ncbi:MAG: hypothetical protein ABJA67_05135, partial [Chthonomonadales bacterium]
MTPTDLAAVRQKMGATLTDDDTALLKALSESADLYIGYSILPAKVVRDNYGHYVRDKFFAADVAISNRASTGTIVISTLEFCHAVILQTAAKVKSDTTAHMKDVSTDPTLVRGSLQKGELTGARSEISNTIQAIGSIMAPAAPFFKVATHRATFTTAAAMLAPLKSGFDLVVPDTIAVYLSNWDKD